MPRMVAVIICCCLFTSSSRAAETCREVIYMRQLAMPIIDALLGNAATLAAKIEAEQEAHKATQAQLKAVTDYWQAWCGDAPGCITKGK